MKKVSLLFTAMVGLLLCVACNSNNPKDVAKEIVNAQIENKMDTIYGMLCTADQSVINKSEFLKRYTQPSDIRQIINLIPEAQTELKASDFKETITGDHAIITYVLTIPDNDKIGQSVLNLSDLQNMINNKGMTTLNDLPEEVKAKIKEYVKKNGIPTKEIPQQMTLIKENEVWKLELKLAEAIRNQTFPLPFER